MTIRRRRRRPLVSLSWTRDLIFLQCARPMHYVIHEYCACWIFHCFPQFRRGGLSRRVISTDFRPFSSFFENHERMTSRRQETRARRSYFFLCITYICVCIWSDFFLIIFLRDSWRRSDDRSSSAGCWKKYCRPTFLWRDEFATQHPGPDFRVACSLVVCYWPFFTIHRWAGRGLGQVDTPNPRTVRNWGWRLTGVCAWKVFFFFLFYVTRHLDSHSISIDLQII